MDSYEQLLEQFKLLNNNIAYLINYILQKDEEKCYEILEIKDVIKEIRDIVQADSQYI